MTTLPRDLWSTRRPAQPRPRHSGFRMHGLTVEVWRKVHALLDLRVNDVLAAFGDDSGYLDRLLEAEQERRKQKRLVPVAETALRGRWTVRCGCGVALAQGLKALFACQ
jgi:hypothetical protein